jgi:hypothetical protein
VHEVFVTRATASAPPSYEPRLLVKARLHYVDAKSSVDVWQAVTLLAPVETEGALSPWEHAQELDAASLTVAEQPAPGARFAELPAAAARAKSWPGYAKSAAAWLYQSRPLKLQRSPELKLCGRPGEADGDFRTRVALAARELRDKLREKQQAKWAPKLRVLQDKERRALDKVRVQEAQYEQQKVSSAVSLGSTLIGALFGRKLGSVGNVSRAGGAVRGISRAAKEKGDIGAAQADLAAVRQQLADLNKDFEAELGSLQAGQAEPGVEELSIAPRKADITIESVELAWVAQ